MATITIMKGKDNVNLAVLVIVSLWHLCICAPTTQMTVASATRWMAPCHPPGSTVVGTIGTTTLTDQEILNIAITHINEINSTIHSLTNKYEDSNGMLALFNITESPFEGFPRLAEIRTISQQPMALNFTEHLIKDFEILSVMAVYAEQAIKDQEHTSDWLLLWQRIEHKIVTVLCSFEKALVKHQQQINNHVQHEILERCTPNLNCKELESLAQKIERDYIVLRITSSIFYLLKQKYEIIQAQIGTA